MLDELIKWVGIVAPLALGSLGSSIGCVIAGMGMCGAMPRIKTGHGGLAAMSAAPSTQIIYGLVLMMFMKGKMAGANTLSPAAFLAVGLLCGTAIMVSAIVQGKCCAAGMRATVEEKSVFGKCWVPIGITESFAVFSMIFGMIVLS
ncbi:MAG: ATP synthase subunit C [Candidatus Brocadiae bacterium]|nr:ATP synthase subunit C [Candidatus Brocadiia bacterium]